LINLINLSGEFFVDISSPDLHGRGHFIIVVIKLFG